MAYSLDDTIVAVATAPGAAVRGVVRLSGPQALECVGPLLPPEAAAQCRRLRHPACWPAHVALPAAEAGHAAVNLPCTLWVWPGRRSYTRQPVVEIHTFGSPPLLDLVVAAAARHGARLAQPGEFTLRAFLAGRLDLTQAEVVLGLIDAHDRREFAAAPEQMAGGLSGPLKGLRNDLLNLLADLEAGLDFVDEDLDFVPPAEVVVRLQAAALQVAQLRSRLRARGIDPQLPRVVPCGWPNVGKSSLFNALLAREAAVVSTQQGTTRDYLSARLDLGGCACQLIDTAGWEPALPPSALPDCIATDAAPPAQSYTEQSPPEQSPPDLGQLAQQAAERQRAQADCLLLCLDSSRALNDWERSQLASPSPRTIVVWTKADQAAGPVHGSASVARPIVTSSNSGAGLESLKQLLRELLSRPNLSGSEAVVSTARRCERSLEAAAAALAAAEALAHSGEGGELLAIELRQTLDALGQILGALYTDDLLDRIFSRFCIGK